MANSVLNDAFVEKFIGAVQDAGKMPVGVTEALRAVFQLPDGIPAVTTLVDTLLEMKRKNSAEASDAEPVTKKSKLPTQKQRKAEFMRNFSKRAHEFSSDPDSFDTFRGGELPALSSIQDAISSNNYVGLAQIYIKGEKIELVGNFLQFEALLLRAHVLYFAFEKGTEFYREFLSAYRKKTGLAISDRTSHRARALLATLFFPFPRLRHLGKWFSWNAFGDNCVDILNFLDVNSDLGDLFAQESFPIELKLAKKVVRDEMAVRDHMDKRDALKEMYWGYDYALIDEMEDEPFYEEEDEALIRWRNSTEGFIEDDMAGMSLD
jgi:hypothetical protein